MQIGDQMGPVEVRNSMGEKGIQLLNTPSLGYMGVTLNVGNVHGIDQKPGTVDTPSAAMCASGRRSNSRWTAS